MSELIIETEESNLPLKPKLDLDTFKSILYWQNVKPDTQIKFFRVRKKVEVSDIYSLNESEIRYVYHKFITMSKHLVNEQRIIR